MTAKFQLIYDDPDKGFYDLIETDDPQVIIDFLDWLGGAKVIYAKITPKSVGEWDHDRKTNS